MPLTQAAFTSPSEWISSNKNCKVTDMLKNLFVCIFMFSGMYLSAGTGDIIAAWNFRNPSVLKSRFALKLRGKTVLDKQGMHIPAGKVREIGGAIVLKNTALLSPADAFKITAQLILDGSAGEKSGRLMIYDSKYVPMPGSAAQKKYHRGFMFFLVSNGKNIFRPAAAFGLGESSVQSFGRNILLSPGKKYQISMEFNATGKVSFYVDGKLNHQGSIPAGKVAPSGVTPVLGDRAGANYQPLQGRLLELEIRKSKYTPVDFSAMPQDRKVFERGEKNAGFPVKFNNFTGSALKEKITVTASSAGKTVDIFRFPRGISDSTRLYCPVDTLLLPGTYDMELTAKDAAGKVIAHTLIPYTVVPAYGDFLPVFLWGNHEDIKAIREAGFTHQIVHIFPRTGDFQSKELARWIPHLDANLKEGLYTFGTLHAHFRFLQARRFLRTDRNGKVYPRIGLEASHPAVKKEFAQAAHSTVKAVAHHPAFDGVLINSEVRDSSLPSFGSGVEPAAFKKFAGYDIPETITGKSPRPMQGDPAFPWDRVISSDRKDLVFLSWFWDRGDGWNPLQTLLSETMHKAVKGKKSPGRFFTFYDPATRVPPMWGSGGNVDMISQWTYSYPDPIKIGQTTDEVIAMAQGNPKQKIGSMTQAIWYRSQTAPANKKVKNPPEWLKDEANAMFISVSPDSLREAFWSKISRRLDVIMYHGVGSLLMKTDHKLYRLTNTQSREVLKELNQKVILPLGPVLKRVPERAVEVAILENLASSFYAPKHYPMGWGRGWTADLHLALQWGHFQPGIIYDEHLKHNRNISNLKVLFVPGLEVVTIDILEKLNALRSKGVILIGDEFTTPALMLDYRIQSVVRNSVDPLRTKKELQKLGLHLAQLLKKHIPFRVTASNQDLIVRQRGNDKADYVFIVNDKRTFGNYVGQWGLVPEKGLFNKGKISVDHKAEAAYDLVQHKEIPLKHGRNSCSFEIETPPGDGACILLLEKKISGIKLAVPRQVRTGKPFELNVVIHDSYGRNIRAYLPVEVEITSAGKKLPGSGFYAATDGKLDVKDIIPTNLAPGKVDVKVRCLSSGKSVQKQTVLAN